MTVLLTTLNAKYIHSSLALRSIKEYCKDVAELRLREFTINHPVLDILSEIYEEKPRIVCFACYIWNVEMTLELIGLLKKVLPKAIVVCGGPEASHQPRACLARGVDYVVLGEGEETMRALLTCLKAGKGVERVGALAYGNGGEIRVGKPAAVARLDLLPFAYRDMDMEELRDKIIYYESSRGCPFACQYCLSSATSGVRFLAVERVLAELAFFIRHGVRQVKFVDRTFNAKKEHFLPILRFLARQDCRANFHFEIAADLLDDEALDVLAAMPKGRVQFEIGVQSTNEKTLAAIRRVNRWERIVQTVTRLLSFQNMHLHLDLIVGLPEEDCASFQQSFNDCYALGADMLQIGFLKLLRGSGMRERAAELGYQYTDAAPYQVLSNRWISYDEMRALQIFEDVFERYYNSGKFVFALTYMVEATGGNAFRFYEGLTRFWRERNLHLAAQSPKSLFWTLIEYCETVCAQCVWALRQLLKFDALRAGGALRPDFLQWNGDAYYEETTVFWREGAAGRYIAGYRFASWREVRKRYHIEVFDFDPTAPRPGGRTRREITPILFDFGAGAYQRIEKSDFWRGKV